MIEVVTMFPASGIWPARLSVAVFAHERLARLCARKMAESFPGVSVRVWGVK